MQRYSSSVIWSGRGKFGSETDRKQNLPRPAYPKSRFVQLHSHFVMFCIINIMIIIRCSSLVVHNPKAQWIIQTFSPVIADFRQNEHDNFVFDPAVTLQIYWNDWNFLSPSLSLDCQLYAVGKPVFFKSSDQNYGAWMRDPLARNDSIAEKIYMTKENDGFQLLEYANKGAFRNNIPSRIYNMQFPFQVN